MEEFIYDNNTLSDSAIVELLDKRFNIKISLPTAFRYLEKARAEAKMVNSAKIEAVREQVLDNANIYAAKYLGMLDQDIEAWNTLLKGGTLETATATLSIENIKDRNSAAASMQKGIGMILQFVAPVGETNVNMNFKPDYSTLTDEELDALELIAVKTARKTKDAPN
jgi:hypothetical protein